MKILQIATDSIEYTHTYMYITRKNIQWIRKQRTLRAKRYYYGI